MLDKSVSRSPISYLTVTDRPTRACLFSFLFPSALFRGREWKEKERIWPPTISYGQDSFQGSSFLFFLSHANDDEEHGKEKNPHTCFSTIGMREIEHEPRLEFFLLWRLDAHLPCQVRDTGVGDERQDSGM